MKDKLLEIINHYGIDKQLKYIHSEYFELDEAIVKNLNEEIIDVKVCLKRDIAEELADVTCMLKQFQYYYEISDEEIEKIMQEKVDRQLERIKKEKVISK